MNLLKAVTALFSGGALGTPSSGDASNLTSTTQASGDDSTKLATTQFVQAAVLQSPAKEAVKYASIAALPAIVYANGSSGVGATLTGVALGAISLDSASPAVADRVLIKNQVSTFQNGIYLVTATGSGAAVFVLTRAIDFDQAADIKTGDSMLVTAGTTLATTTWDVNSLDAPVMGTDAITFAQTASLVTGANPTASAGIAAVNGSAATFMRSDGAPAVPAATATVAGLVPTPPNNTTTFLRGDATFAAPASSGPTLGTQQATTSGTSKNFSGIPAGTKRITIIFDSVSFDGTTDMLLVQIGDAGGIETTGYVSLSGGLAAAPVFIDSTAGFIILRGAAATHLMTGHMVLTLIDAASFKWVESHAGMYTLTNGSVVGGGQKALSAELTQVTITRNGPTDSFDAGAVNILYE